MRRILLPVGAAALHLVLTLVLLGLSFGAAARQLATSAPPTLPDRVVEIAAYAACAPLLLLAHAAGVNLLAGSALYAVAAANSALCVVVVVLAGRFHRRRAGRGSAVVLA